MPSNFLCTLAVLHFSFPLITTQTFLVSGFEGSAAGAGVAGATTGATGATGATTGATGATGATTGATGAAGVASCFCLHADKPADKHVTKMIDNKLFIWSPYYSGSSTCGAGPANGLRATGAGAAIGCGLGLGNCTGIGDAGASAPLIFSCVRP